MKKRIGFTLIELLIVVAIIAILAAIAVPNFLEAQMRAKISSVQSDLRSLTTGIESFQVENNIYPRAASTYKLGLNAGPADKADANPNIKLRLTFASIGQGNTSDAMIGTGANARKLTLTTPVAYLAQIPNDVFAESSGVVYGYANAADMGWIVWSASPTGGEGTSLLDSSLKQHSRYGGKGPSGGMDPNTWKFGSCTVYNPGRNNPSDDLKKMTYDGTNGTSSAGDIWKLM
jgi:prepilin-type N-terminal cleavage/methylation domain-containing protein